LPKADIVGSAISTHNAGMPTLLLKPLHELTEQDFVQHPTWVAYFEPDELDDLQRLGIDREQAQRELGALEHPDHFVFQLPREAAFMSFKYLYVRANLTTAGGSKLIGYVTGPCVGVFHKGERYQFNQALHNRSEASSRKLASALRERTIFPLRIEIPATGKVTEFSLD
jgi:hypothetical protein